MAQFQVLQQRVQRQTVQTTPRTIEIIERFGLLTRIIVVDEMVDNPGGDVVQLNDGHGITITYRTNAIATV